MAAEAIASTMGHTGHSPDASGRLPMRVSKPKESAPDAPGPSVVLQKIKFFGGEAQLGFFVIFFLCS
jgi:hypothetical protein